RAALPDLVVAAQEDVQLFAERGSELKGQYDPQVADHDLWGIFVAAGPAFRHVEPAQELRLLDVAPTALHLLGLPVPDEMKGTVPLPFLVNVTPPRRCSEASFAAAAPPRDGAAYTPEEIQTLERNLHALGYQ